MVIFYKMKKSIPAIAFDFTGVFSVHYKGSQPYPSAVKALNLLNKYRIPFVVLTNAGGRSDAERCEVMNRAVGVQGAFRVGQVIQAHTPMQSIMKRELTNEQELALVGGGEETWKILEQEWKVNNFVTVQEMAAIFPTLVPLSYKAHYPDQQTCDTLKQRVKARLGLDNLDHIMTDRQFRTIFVMSNPYMWETHMQIMSDVLFSEQGRIGTVRAPDAEQWPTLYYAQRDLVIPFKDDNHPALKHRFSLGVFADCFENIFHRQYKEEGYKRHFKASMTGKPSALAFDCAKERLKKEYVELYGNQGQVGKLYMVGDSLTSDIYGGNQNGFDTVLVTTGNYKEGMPIAKGCEPQMIVQDVGVAVEKIIADFI
ncbi:hypothetical protein FGO68_gene9088 [Halteria grandinella]|uniref:Uncharacterized protein n=1 Tax=Halteria grandinella TaxID=5974 RepID=A0A8J8T0P9_HALGN|nr:hypothetical protein FGO68_gene9088 [Halteria grandinella]